MSRVYLCLPTCLGLSLLGLFLTFAPHLVLAEIPRVSVVPPPASIRVGEVLPLQVEIRWQGRDDQIQILGLKNGGEGVTQGAMEHTQHQTGGETLHTLNIQLVANLPGEVELAPLSLTYRDEAGITQTLDIPGSWLVRVLPAPSVAGRVLVGTLGTVIIGAVWWWRRRKRVTTPKQGPPPISTRELLDQARQALERGQAEQVLITLIQLKPQLPPAEDLLPSADLLEQERMKLRYGGYTADATQLGRWLRSVEVTLNRTNTP